MPITGSVGNGGNNQLGDVLFVQLLLADWLVRTGNSPIAVDGSVGPMTVAAIEAFQTATTGIVDGRIDAGGPALDRLEASHIDGLKQNNTVAAFPTRLMVPGMTNNLLPTGSSPDPYFQQFLAILRAGLD
jgi:peptidoglycan hydrolase-like protein with peptidoglycan-binding domain